MKLLLTLRCGQLLQNRIEAAGNLPFRVVRLKLSQVRDVTDVIALARLLHIVPVQFAPGELFDTRNGFEHRDAVAASPAQVVDLAWPRIRSKFFDGSYYVTAVNIVAHLLAFVAINAVARAAQRNFHQVR